MKAPLRGILLSLVFILLAGSVPASAKTIVDMAGNEVDVPDKVERILITCYGGATHELTVLGGADLLVGQPSMKPFPLLAGMHPSFKEIPDAGSFNNVNVEEALKLNPDLVIASVTSAQGNRQLAEAGLPVVAVLTGKADVEKIQREFLLVGSLIGREERAQRLVDYWQKVLKLLEERTAPIPREERKRVYYMLGNFLHTNGSDWWGEFLITTAGGINVASELGRGRDINAETLLRWDPDDIIVSGNEGSLLPPAELRDHPQIGTLRAVRENRLHYCPVGAFWWDRPSPEAILGFLWLGKTLYPSRFADVDLTVETKAFFREFYDATLSDEDVQLFFNPAALARQ
ncbi:ABC transporter substrate-binding protein [Aminirod propionatiphilus]